MTENLNQKLDLLTATFKELFSVLPSIASDKEFIEEAYQKSVKNIENAEKMIAEIASQRETLKRERGEILTEIVSLDTRRDEMSRIDKGITERLKLLSNLSDREIAISGLEKDLEKRSLDLDMKEKDLVERENHLKTEIDLDRIRKETLSQKEKALSDKEARFTKVMANYTS